MAAGRSLLRRGTRLAVPRLNTEEVGCRIAARLLSAPRVSAFHAAAAKE